MSRTQGLAVVIVAIILIIFSPLIGSITTTEEKTLLNQTVSVSGLSWKRVDFWVYEGDKVYGSITSNRPVDVYVNYQGNGITVYNWGALGVTQASFDISIGTHNNHLDIYNPNILSATVQVDISERIISFPYSSFSAYLFYFAIILLSVGLILTFMGRKRITPSPT